MKMLNLPEFGYTPSNYAALVELTQLSNVGFYQTFNIAKNTFYHHRDGTRTIKWQEWQALLTTVTNFIKENDMSKYITCVGRSRVNNFSFDIYENQDSSASIRANKLGHDLPTSTWLTYESAEAAIDFVEEACGDLEGAQRALYFWNHSGIAEKIKEKADDNLMKEQLSSMSAAEQNHYFSQKQCEIDEKFIKDSNYFM